MAHGHEHDDHGHGGLDDIHADLDTTPVHAAARDGDANELQTILAADPTQARAVDKYGLTPLHWASDRGHADAAELLLAAGADADAVEARLFKRRPLHFAVLSGSLAAVETLVRHKADLEAADYRGWSPAQVAANRGDAAEAVAVLVAAGAVAPKTSSQA